MLIFYTAIACENQRTRSSWNCKIFDEQLLEFLLTGLLPSAVSCCALGGKIVYQRSSFISYYQININFNPSAHMRETTILLVILALTLPAVLAVDCGTVAQTNCGVAGGDCPYFTWSNGTCVAPTSCPTTPTATVWSNSSFNCVPCYGSSSTNCALCSSQNFFYDDGLQTCTTCSAKYGSSCVNCSTTACTKCETGLTLTSDGQSCFNGTCGIEFCVTCSSSTACSACDSTHSLINGVCACVINNCQVCSKGMCSSCNTGYSIDTSKTKCNLICIDYCKSCTDSSSCQLCFTGYYYDSGLKKCRPNCTAIDPKCISCSSTVFCEACSSSYSLSASGVACNPICTDSNCNTCLGGASICTQCKSGYKVTTSNTCSSDICEISNCASCGSSTTCSACSSYYKLSTDNKTCMANCNVNNCLYCKNLTACEACTFGFKVVSGSCSAICSISNCALCATQSTCQTCNAGFLLSTNSQTCSYNCGILGCVTCNGTSTCSQCYPGYNLGTGAKSCIITCQDGFYLSGSACSPCPTANCQSCDSKGICLSCLNLYYRNPSTYTCDSCSSIENCYLCDANGLCTTCKNGFFLVSGACISASSCTVTNCQVCVANSPTTCYSCNEGFTLTNSNTACQQITCSGNQYLVGSTCTCGAKSYLQSGSCVSCSDPSCLACTQSLCTDCLDGYYPSGTACIACPSNCLSCDSSGCITCNTGFLKKSGVCTSPPSTKTLSVSNTGVSIICPTGCLTCDLDSSSNTICRTAADGYVLASGVIYKCDPVCATCQNVADSTGSYTNCITCPNGYAYNAGTCTGCVGANALTCSSSNASYTLTCAPGYNAESGVCNACGGNCMKCGSAKSGSCDVGGCANGFFQSKGISDCVTCFNGCLNCGTDPNTCLQCGDYKYLSSNVCYSCIDNCITCSSGTTCDTCQLGYLYAVSGACKLPNIDGCVSYDENVTCSQCDYNYNLTNGKCVLLMTCNVTSTCKNCKDNYYISAGQCFNCPVLSNCDSCDQFSKNKCSRCTIGYYLNGKGVCIACPQTGCLDCASKSVCSTAQPGYYLVVNILNQKTGNVKVCQGLCATCITGARTCLTCKTGSTLTGSQCMSDNNKAVNYVGYLKTLGENPTTSSSYEQGAAISVFSRFIGEMAKAMKFDSLETFLANSNIKNLKKRSIDMNFVVNSDSLTVDPKTALISATFSDMKTLAIGVVTNTATTSTSSSVNLALVLGVSIPLGVLLVVIIIILKVKSTSSDDTESGLDGTEKEMEIQDGDQF